MTIKSKKTSIILVSLIIALVYSILRYNVFKDIPWIDFPLYVFNKALSLSAIMLFAYYQYSIINNKLKADKVIRNYAILLVIMHILISFIILKPKYFPKFFDDGSLNIVGVVSLISGVIAIGIILVLLSKYFKLDKKLRLHINKLANLFYILIAIHVVVFGFDTWFLPSSWPGFMPPITMISFVLSLYPVYYYYSKQ